MNGEKIKVDEKLKDSHIDLQMNGLSLASMKHWRSSTMQWTALKSITQRRSFTLLCGMTSAIGISSDKEQIVC